MKFISSLVVLFFINTLALAETAVTHTSAVPGVVATPIGSFEVAYDLETVKGNKIEQDGKYETYNYIVPNEFYSNLFEGCLPKEGGAYISVGTFRAMNMGASPRVSHLVMMDISKSAFLFNKINVQLIAKAQDRHQYLSYLLTGEAQPEIEKQVKLGASAGGISEQQFISWLRARSTPKIQEKWKNDLKLNFSNEEWSEITYQVDPYRTIPALASALDTHFSIGNYDKTLMGNDSRFEKMKRMIQDKKVTIVNGDIAGEKTLTSLAEAFRKEDIKVAGVDYSNAPGYFAGNTERTKKMMASLRNLPFREKGRVLYTDFHTSLASKGLDRWAYASFNKDHLEGLERNELPRFESYRSGNGNLPKFQTFKAAGQEHTLVKDPTNPAGLDKLFSSGDAPCEEIE
jgi:hypothetical protein